MLPESIRAAPSDFEAWRLLQSTLPGTRMLFDEVIGRMDRVKSFASRGLIILPSGPCSTSMCCGRRATPVSTSVSRQT